ncbi:MAG: hypothetical protein WCG81_18810 [Candidatus Angelobacter sp.]
MQPIPLPSLVNFFSPENGATENMGQGTSDCGVGSNHQPPYGDRQPKYPQSSPLTETHEQGASPWQFCRVTALVGYQTK